MSVSLHPSLCIPARVSSCVCWALANVSLLVLLSVCLHVFLCLCLCPLLPLKRCGVCVCVRARVHLERFQDKQDVIAGYMFHVVIENTQTNCYFTEKVRQRGQTVGMTAHACLPCAPACSFALSLLLCSFFLAPLLFPPPLGTRPPPSLSLSRPPTRARTHC